MKSTLSLYNTLSRRKERFEPLEPLSSSESVPGI